MAYADSPITLLKYKKQPHPRLFYAKHFWIYVTIIYILLDNIFYK